MSVVSHPDLYLHIVLFASFPVLRTPSLGSAGRHNNGCNRPGPVPPASPWVASRARRVLDCTLAALALLLLLPVLLACWMLVRFTSPGPAFFRQHRMGRNGQLFQLYKFRSMRIETHHDGPTHTVHDDRRITPVGAFLRRYKLDELPQFWNVLKGDMSLVGPRPKLPSHEALHMPYRPGLTGQATLAFRFEERMLLEVPAPHVDRFYEDVVKPIKASLDIRYMERASFFTDVELMWRTFHRCFDSAGDARQELENLLRTYAPHHPDALVWPRPVAAPIRLRSANPLFAEIADDFADDLDDAA